MRFGEISIFRLHGHPLPPFNEVAGERLVEVGKGLKISFGVAGGYSYKRLCMLVEPVPPLYLTMIVALSSSLLPLNIV